MTEIELLRKLAASYLSYRHSLKGQALYDEEIKQMDELTENWEKENFDKNSGEPGVTPNGRKRD